MLSNNLILLLTPFTLNHSLHSLRQRIKLDLITSLRIYNLPPSKNCGTFVNQHITQLQNINLIYKTHQILSLRDLQNDTHSQSNHVSNGLKNPQTLILKKRNRNTQVTPTNFPRNLQSGEKNYCSYRKQNTITHYLQNETL